MSEILKRGLIIYGVGGLYLVRLDTSAGQPQRHVLCSARGIFRRDGITPVAGDSVTVSLPTEHANKPSRTAADKSADDGVVICTIGERKNVFIRPPLANLNTLYVVIAAAEPKTEPLTVDKLIAIAEHKDVTPVVVVTKSDLDPESARSLSAIYTHAGFEVFIASGVTGTGIDSLRERVLVTSCDTQIAAFSGASGAGKSTLMNALFPSLRLATNDVSRKIGRGRHTTRAVTLYCAGELTENEAHGRLFIADTPGFSMLDFTENDFFPLSELPYTFREFAPYLGKCRWSDCTHLCEDGCAVVGAVAHGEIENSRHDSFVRIYADIKAKPEWAREKEKAKKPR